MRKRGSTKNLDEEVFSLRSRVQCERLVRWIGRDPIRFAQLMELFLHGDNRTTQLAGWIMTHCIDRHPRLATPWLAGMVKKMQDPEQHESVKRNVVRSLQFAEIPRRLMGRITAICFEYLSDISEPIAVRVFSMVVLERIAMMEPDLKPELATIIEQLLPFGTGAYRSRAVKVLKRLRA